MTPPDRPGFLANSAANLLVGAAALGYGVIVPAVVLRRFGAELYGTWYLAFQIAAYILLLDLGSQYIVSRDTAAADGPPAARLATAAMVVQSALAAVVLAVATTWAAIAGQGDLARFVIVLGLGATGSLVASTVRAWFVGLQRAHVPAMWLVGARVAAVAGLAVAVVTDSGLVLLSAAVAGPQLAVHAAFLLWARRPPSPWITPDRAAFGRLIRHTSPLALWTLAGILIAGVDIFVVRAVDPSEVGRYAIALPLLAVPTGIVTAAMTAWMPRVAAGGAGGPGPTLGATSTMVAALSMGAIPFVAFADELVTLWAGSGDWHAAATYLRILYLASCLRYAFLPWSILILVRGEQGRITAAPITEAAVNLAASVALGIWLGATGVAAGTLVGALTASFLYFAWAVPRTAGSGITARALAGAGARAWLPLAGALALTGLTLTGAPALWRAAGAAVLLGIGGWWMRSRRPALAGVS